MTMSQDEYENETPPTPAEAVATATKAKTALVVKVEGWEADRVLDAVAFKLAERLDERVQEAINEKVTAMVEDALVTAAQERIQAELEKVLAEGWQPTDEYGAKKGPPKMLKDRISDILNAKEHGYGSSRPRWFDEVVTKAVQASISKDFEAEWVQARTSFRKQVDELLAGKIVSGLREAFGLSR